MPDPTAKLRPIHDVAGELGLAGDDIEARGRWRAKLALTPAAPGSPGGGVTPKRAKLVLVTGVTPTSAGEGKTVTALGLGMGMARLGQRAVCCLRQSSLGPTFGGKGGGAGGGAARVEPLDEALLGPGEDIFAVESATNLLAAVADDVARLGKGPLTPEAITWRRAIDVDDRGLRHIVSGLGGRLNGPMRETGFDITAASEVMAVLGMSRDLADLRARLGAIVVGFAGDTPIRAEELGAAGAMAALCASALEPNLLQTNEGTPVIIHTGPFANIAHGNSSVVADLLCAPRADYLLTEAGFGADLGAEKFFHLKSPVSGIAASAVVLVATARAIEDHGDTLEPGLANLRRHIENLRQFGVPVVLALNRFPEDARATLDAMRATAQEAGAAGVAEHSAYTDGGAGSEALAAAVVDACNRPSHQTRLYNDEDSVFQKVETLAARIYGAADVQWQPAARTAATRYAAAGFGQLPVCVAKTPLSLSHDPARRGAPSGYTLPVRDLRLSAGAGFLVVYLGDIVTMPGLPSGSRYRGIDVDPATGRITGLA